MSTSTHRVHQPPTPTKARRDAARVHVHGASLWDHPRSPQLETVDDRVIIRYAGETIAETEQAVRVVRPHRSPVYFIPPTDVQREFLIPVTAEPIGAVFMPIQYWHVLVGGAVATCSAWSYPEPLPVFEALRDYLAFDAAKMDACYVGDQWVLPDGERVAGGWITFDAQLVAAMNACAELQYW